MRAIEPTPTGVRNPEKAQDQFGAEKKNDHPEEPPVAGGPRRLLDRPEHPDARGTLDNVPGEVEQQPHHYTSQYGPVPPDGHRSDSEHDDRSQGMRDRALTSWPEPPEVEGHVIKVNGHGRDESCNVETARRLDKAGYDEQTEGRGS